MQAVKSPLSATFVFRADGYPEIGFGHLQRSLALAQLLLKHADAKIYLLTNQETQKQLKNFSTQLSQVVVYSSHELDLFLRQLPPQFTAILDSYQVSALNDFKRLKHAKPQARFLALDDIGEKIESVHNGLLHGLINGSLGANSIMYPEAILAKSAIGHKFLYLREEFSQHPKWSEASLINKSITITMGGSDPFQQTQRSAQALLVLPEINQLNLIFGPGFTEDSQITKQFGANPKLRIFKNPKHLLKIFTQSSLVLTAGGSTINELAFLHIPMLVLILSNDQQANANTIQSTGIGLELGRYDKINDQDIKMIASQLLSDPNKLINMHNQARLLMQHVHPNNIVKYLLGV